MVRMTQDADALLDGFARLDSAAVSDALDDLRLLSGLGGFSPQWGRPKLVGLAATVQLEPYVPGPSGAHIASTAVARSGPRHVIVVANEGRTDVSCWGGLLSRSTGAGSAAAAAGDQLMLGHPHPDRGQVEHLPALHTHPWGRAQVGAAATARARLMPQDLVRIGDLSQRRPGMTGLPTGLTPAAAAQRFRGRLDERRVRRGRLRRVPRVQPQPALQLGVLRPQRGNLGLQPRDRRRLLRNQDGKLVIRRTPSPGLHTKIIPQRRSRKINDLTSYLAEIPQCGHFPMYSNPPVMWARIARFIERSEG
jgi:hypothetical protein